MILEGILGSVFGLIGSAFTAWNNYKMKQLEIEDNKAKRDHELALIDAQTKATIAEVEAQIKVTIAKTDAEIDLADSENYGKVLEAANKPFISSEWINYLLQGGKIMQGFGVTIVFLLSIAEFIKDIMRPAMTGWSNWLAAFIIFKAFVIANTMDSPFTNAQVLDIVNKAIELAFFLATSSFTWWFGDRSMNKFIQKRYNK